MFREAITDGDLMVLSKPWWSFGLGSYRPHRNLSEEVRHLKTLEEKALSKYLELSNLYTIASTNVAEKLETLQILLLDNSDAWFEVEVDNSILEKKEGVRYNFNRGKDKKDSSSNKDGQQKQQQKQQQDQKQNSNKPRGIPLSELFLKGRITLN